MRPPIPVPRTCARLTPRSLASLRTIGVTYASCGCALVATTGAGAGAETTGAGAGAGAETGGAT